MNVPNPVFDIHIVFSEGNYRTVHFLSFLLVGEHSYIKQLSITAERRISDMKKFTDVRCNVSPELKTKIKLCAIAENTSVSKWLLNLIEERVYATEQQGDTAHLENELQKILTQLSNSASLSVSERENLKRRKMEIKALLQKGA